MENTRLDVFGPLPRQADRWTLDHENSGCEGGKAQLNIRVMSDLEPPAVELDSLAYT